MKTLACQYGRFQCWTSLKRAQLLSEVFQNIARPDQTFNQNFEFWPRDYLTRTPFNPLDFEYFLGPILLIKIQFLEFFQKYLFFSNTFNAGQRFIEFYVPTDIGFDTAAGGFYSQIHDMICSSNNLKTMIVIRTVYRIEWAKLIKFTKWT